MTYRDALKEAMREALRRDETAVIMGEEVGVWGGTYAVTRGLYDEFGAQRVIDTPIAEMGIIGVATGAAMGGMKPIAEIMTINFALVAIDQIVNNTAKIHSMFGGTMRAPVVIRTTAGWGQLAATHSQSFEAWFAYVPGLIVVMPSTAYDAKGLLTTAMYSQNPVIFIEHTRLYGEKGELPKGEFRVPFGVADVKRQGKDLTIVTYSRMTHVALNAAKDLAQQGIEVEVVDVRSLRPLDWATIMNSVRKTHRALVLTEDWMTFGVSGEIAARIAHDAFDYLDAPVERMTQAEVPLPYAPNLEKMAFPDEAKVFAKIKEMLA
ncbi:MAG: alpha-ketoacid dehydrogenase subunit beta [Chloroflexi bacterium UTCFX4]|nr:MAG: alpha-ketoacid dehydrogenase subunit beta [Chloroflexi bacterium UTCFX4]